jgi:hypothetical protein
MYSMVTSTGYRFLRTSEIEGTLECDGEDKHLSKYEEDGLCLELLEPFRAGALPAEYSELEIRYRAGRSSTFAGIGPATSRSSCTSQAIGSKRCSIGQNLFRSISSLNVNNKPCMAITRDKPTHSGAILLGPN